MFTIVGYIFNGKDVSSNIILQPLKDKVSSTQLFVLENN